MRARQAFTRSDEVTLPARSRAEASESVSAASASGERLDETAGGCGRACGGAPAVSTRAAAPAAPRIETVNSRRERWRIGRYLTPRSTRSTQSPQRFFGSQILCELCDLCVYRDQCDEPGSARRSVIHQLSQSSRDPPASVTSNTSPATTHFRRADVPSSRTTCG